MIDDRPRTLSTCAGCGQRPLRDEYHWCPALRPITYADWMQFYAYFNRLPGPLSPEQVAVGLGMLSRA